MRTSTKQELNDNRVGRTKFLSLCALIVGLFAGVAKADEAALLSALTSLEQHVTGSSVLNGSQIAAHKQTIDNNSTIFGDSSSLISASFDLVQAYEANIGPMWAAGTPTSNGFTRNNLTDDIHWTTYNVMQNIMDDTYNSANLQTQAALLGGYKFESADVVPGQVQPPANPTAVYTATVDGSFLDTFGRDTQQWTLPARKATGTYLAPGSIATVTVPSSLVGQGYQIRVGGHSIDLFNRNPVQRLERASLLYDVNSTEVQIASPLGGSIYLEVPYGADAGVVDLDIQNAVRSPFFSMQDFNTTTLQEWQNVERHFDAPWADFQTEKYMMHVPTSWIYNFDDPVTLMQNWDKAIDVTNDLMGFPRDRGKETLFNVVDVVIRANAFSPGYPSVNVTYNPDTNYNGNHNHYLLNGPQDAQSQEFHELGHAYLFPKFPGEVESVVNLLHVAVWQEGFGYDWDTAFAGSRDFDNNPHRTLDNTAVTWMTSFNFYTRDLPMDRREKNYQLKGYAKFVEVARLYGWDKLGDFYQAYNQDEEDGVASPTDVDGMLLRMAESVGVDTTPLFHFWGIHPQDPTQLAADISSAGLESSQEILDLLLHYRSLVPDDNAEFRQFATDWWGGQPSLGGFWTESEHARQWDETELFNVVDGLGRTDTQQTPNGEIYNGNSAALIFDRIDELIQLYFPDLDPDLNGDGIFDTIDWRILRNNWGVDMTGLTTNEAFAFGDLDGDFDNDLDDLNLFRSAYQERYGTAALAALTAVVPEPGCLALVLLAGMCSLSSRRRLTRFVDQPLILPFVTLILISAQSSGLAIAADISWSNPFDISVAAGNSTDVDTSFGTLVEAYTGTTPNSPLAGTDVTVNGFTFVATTDLLPGASEATNDFSAATNTSNGGDAAYDALVSSVEYGGGGDLFTIAIGDGDGNGSATSTGNLSVGAAYQIQIWFVDDRTGSVDDRQMQFGDGNGNTVTLNDQYAIGTFVADAATQNISLDALDFGNAHLTAYALTGGIELPVLMVNTDSGGVTLANNSSTSFDMNFYQLTSDSGSLDSSSWISIEDGAGVSAGFFGGNGVGNGWEELGDPNNPLNPPNDSLVSETFILGSSELSTGESISFGEVFDTTGTQDLEFQIQLTDGHLFNLPIVEVTDQEADFDGDGDVDNADLSDPILGWQARYGNDLNGNDFLVWQQQFSASASSQAATLAVPEPNAALLLGLATLACIHARV